MMTNIDTLSVVAALALLLTGLGFTVRTDPYVRKNERRIMLIIVCLCFSLIAQSLWENKLISPPWNLTLRAYLSVYGYSARPVILILFLYIIQPNGKKTAPMDIGGG